MTTEVLEKLILPLPLYKTLLSYCTISDKNNKILIGCCKGGG